MKQRLLLEYWPQTEDCRWMRFTGHGGVSLPAHAGRVDDFIAAYQQLSGAEVAMVVHSDEIALREVSYEESERKHILSTARYELEDELISAVEDLHFAYGSPASNRLQLAYVDRQRFAEWLAPFQEYGVQLSAVVSSVTALAGADKDSSSSDAWVVNSSANVLSLRQQQRGMVARFDTARLMFDLAQRADEALPDAIHLFADDDEQLQKIEQSLPAALLPLVQRQGQPWFAGSSWQQFQQSAINLLQGDFSPRVAWARLWSFWKLPAILFAGGLLVFSGAQALENRQLRSEHDRLQQDMVSVYLEAFPGSRVSDPERQMRGKLNELDGIAEPSRFMPLFFSTGKVLGATAGVSLVSLSYEPAKQELRADLQAKKFNDVELITKALAEIGVEAELENIISVEDGERARMKFRELE